jgi:exopolysaccharide biosynthesis polyprenyl glycosylphosphotransferase
VFKKHHALLMGIFFCLDISLTLFALAVARWWYRMSGAVPPGFRIANPYPYLIVGLIWTIVFRLLPVYTSKRATRLFVDLITIGEAVFMAWAALVAWALVFDYVNFPREVLIYFGLLDLIFLLVLHLMLRLILRVLRAMNYNQKQVLIIGAGSIGQEVARALQERPTAGFAVLGFLDPNLELQGATLMGLPVLGDLHEARHVAETLQVNDEVIITLSPDCRHEISELIQSIEDIPLNVRVVPDLYGVASIRPTVEDLWGIPLIGIRQHPVLGAAEFTKRAMDLIGAALGLIIGAPVMAVVAVVIKLDSPGPVFFVQRRVGANGRTFNMYKFRTMFLGAADLLDQLVDINSLAEPVFKVKDDPRVTRTGRFLRRSSLDELPQLFNVLKGEMSLVGPRPEETWMVQRYTSWQRKRLMMKPGMTGPMQVAGRADLSFQTRLQLELDYIANYSIWRDLQILILTVPAVIRGRGSY